MDFNDNEFKARLADDPLKQHGFTDELRQLIERRLDTEAGIGQKKSRKRRLWFAFAGTAVTAAAFFFAVDAGRLLSPKIEQTAIRAGNMASTPLRADFESTIRSALLIGLRSDNQDAAGESSSYRTLLIAPDQAKLRRVAEGSGIIMPYKTDFWRLVEEQISENQGDSRYFKAVLASGTKDSSPKRSIGSADKTEPKVSLVREKLLFVGNRYIAVEQAASLDHDSTAERDYVWVKELPQLTAAKSAATVSIQEPHVRLADLFGDSAAPVLRNLNALMPPLPRDSSAKQITSPLQPDHKGESWTISRKPGQWVPQLADYEPDSASTSNGKVAANADKQDIRLKDVPLSLPESVVSHDKLAISLSEIKKVQPAAIDAFSSPNRDIVLVVTENSLIIYPLIGQLQPNPLLTIERYPHEMVIMAHWAADPYIDSWKKNVTQYLAQNP